MPDGVIPPSPYPAYNNFGNPTKVLYGPYIASKAGVVLVVHKREK